MELLATELNYSKRDGRDLKAGEDRQIMSVLPSGAPSHTTRSAGSPSKWRIISWAVDTWEEEGDRSCEVSSPPQIPLEFYESYMLIPDVLTFVMSPWICVTPGSGAMACRSTATIFTSSPPSPFSSRPLSAKTNQVIIKRWNLNAELHKYFTLL